ncbi:MAG: hypothetical protein OXN16_06855 [Gammaproteobacteria bacterium]|nr:hypothetical protein [Gammaproteobacteria bacterium]
MARRKISGFKYTASATERIRQMEADKIAEFFAEIPRQAVTQAVSIFPNLQGFRPNSEQEVHQQVQLLTKRLVKGKLHRQEDVQRDFDVLGFAWMLWGIEHLGDASIVDEYIDRSQAEEQNVIGDGDEEANGDKPLVIELFNRLRKLSHSNRCRRADIKRFFAFSPFSETEHLRSIIDSCKPAAEVAHDINLSKLPIKFERAEREIANLFETVDALSKDDNAHTETLTALRKDVDSLQKAASDSSEIALQLHKRMDDMLKEIERQEKQAAEEATTGRKLVQNIATLIENLQGDLAEISDQVNLFIERSMKADEAIMSINAMHDQMHELITEVLAIVNYASTTEWPTNTETNSAAKEVGQARNIAMERLRKDDRHTEPATLQQGEDLVRAVAANFEYLNIKKSSAEALALECVAALMAGQIPHFSGVNGKRVAEACAVALAANDTYVLTVPVGISAPFEFRQQLDSLSAKKRQDVGCVIIEGINRSALDAFGECLVDMISRQRSGDRQSRSLLLIATLTDGPASLPLSVAHVSLGPVFCTDAVEWRLRHRRDAQITDGKLSTETWEEVYDVADRAAPDSEEVVRLLSEFAPIANPLLRGTILSGFHALSALQNEKTALTALQSLAFGWLAPLCIVMETSANVVDQEFDQGNIDGTGTDKRLANLLHSGIFISDQDGGVL